LGAALLTIDFDDHRLTHHAKPAGIHGTVTRDVRKAKKISPQAIQ
jgi:hypothetical protein